MTSGIDKIAFSMRYYLQIHDLGDAAIRQYANEIFKLAKRGYSHENLQSEISRLQVNGSQQPLDLVICGRVAKLALEAAGVH